MHRIVVACVLLVLTPVIASCALFGDAAEREAYRAAQQRLIVLAICGGYGTTAETTYLEIDGHDPDKELLTTLRKRGLRFVKGSEYPGSASPVDSPFVPEKLSIGRFTWLNSKTAEVKVVRGTETRYFREVLRVRKNDRGQWRLIAKEGRRFP